MYAVTEEDVKETYSAFYVINIVFQSIFTLVWQIGLSVLIGVGTGLVSMVRFILAAMKSLEHIEQQKLKKKKRG